MKFLTTVIISAMCLCGHGVSAEVIKSYVIQKTGKPAKYGEGFTRIAYVNPDAQQGGTLNMAAIGAFDTLNPYSFKGTAPAALTHIENNVLHESLGMQFYDDPYTIYGFLAEAFEYDKTEGWMIVHLRKIAHFHDGSPITADDVIFTFNRFMQKGNPFYRAYYADVGDVIKLDTHRVKFIFKNKKNHELPEILAQLPVLSKKAWEGVDFNKEMLNAPMGSGPYRVKKAVPGKYIVYERVANNWSRKLPFMKGVWNYNEIRYDYYRDSTLTLQAFLSGEYDLRGEVDPVKWVKEYKGPAIASGKVVKKLLPDKLPKGFLGLFYNLRRETFQNIALRRALKQLFDFEWLNKHIFYGAYARIHSYHHNSPLASAGLPAGRELEILNEYKDKLPAALFKEVYDVPKTDGTGQMRAQKRKALQLFKEAGYIIENKMLVQGKTKQPLKFSIMLRDPFYEKVVQPFVTQLRDLGAEVILQTVDSSQYTARMQNYDFDMTVGNILGVFSPGNEQTASWSSKVADKPGADNIAGLKNEVVDALLARVNNAKDWDELVATTKALDRVLLWQDVAIPFYASADIRLAYWDRFGMPDEAPPYSLGFLHTWWVEPQKHARLAKDLNRAS